MQIFAGKIFENPIEIIEAFDNESFIESFKKIEKLRKTHKYYLLGYVRYEAKDIFLDIKIKTSEPLLYFEVFDSEQKTVNSKQKKTVGQDCYPYISSTIDFDGYSKSIEQIKEEIANGNTYEVNYTYDYKVEIDMDGFEFYKTILPNQKTPYNAYIKNSYEEILSFSPELFFTLVGNKIKTKPMKGTIERGKTEQEDKLNIEFLQNDIKNQSENIMIVDLLRNDLGRIAKTGTVKVDKLFDIETHKTVHQMTSEISAELDDNTTLFDIFNAVFPCGSITGAPKINTMDIIDKVEVGKRGVYCGAIGLIAPEKTVFSVPIRILRRKTSESFFLCRVGGAIVWDSVAKDEWNETLTKIGFLSKFSTAETAVPLYKLVETILVKKGKMKYKNKHFDRMKKSAKALGFKFNSDILKLAPKNDCMLRILLNKEGEFEIQELPLKEMISNKISISQTQINSKERFLYHKTTHRPWYETSKEKIKSGEIFDEIFFNENGELTEGSRTNVVLQICGELHTPPIECGLLNGVLREKLLKEKKIKEKKLYLSDLKQADKIFCINSVRGIIEVEL